MEPTTFAQLETLLFPTCEQFLENARRIAARQGVSLTITHKSRNTPGKRSTQYRGTLVLNCIEWVHGCTFEIKAYGPIDGGWRMRPLQHPGLSRHTVTSWALCNHSRVPLRTITPPDISSWTELLPLYFPGPDEVIAAVHHVAKKLDHHLQLLTLMISDGKPKPNGRNTVYIPRGFLTLECVEAENGCPMAIKCREEEQGWQMRPWREKGRSDLKGAVSTLKCKHGPDVAAAYRLKKAEKATKGKGKGKDSSDEAPLSHHTHPSLLPAPSQQDTIEDDIPSGLVDPALMASGADSFGPLSQEDLLGAIEHSFNSGTHGSFFNDDVSFQATFAGHTGSSSSFPSSVEQFRSNLAASVPFGSFTVPSVPSPPVSSPPSLSPVSSPKQSQKRSLDESTIRPAKRTKTKKSDGDVNVSADVVTDLVNGSGLTSHGTDGSVQTNAPTSSKVSWMTFLTTLDPEGRLDPLIPALTKDGGIDPGAVVCWPPNEVSEFADSVAGDVPHGVRIHFRVLLVGQGKKVWDELTRASSV